MWPTLKLKVFPLTGTQNTAGTQNTVQGDLSRLVQSTVTTTLTLLQLGNYQLSNHISYSQGLDMLSGIKYRRHVQSTYTMDCNKDKVNKHKELLSYKYSMMNAQYSHSIMLQYLL